MEEPQPQSFAANVLCCTVLIVAARPVWGIVDLILCRELPRRRPDASTAIPDIFSFLPSNHSKFS